MGERQRERQPVIGTPQLLARRARRRPQRGADALFRSDVVGRELLKYGYSVTPHVISDGAVERLLEAHRALEAESSWEDPGRFRATAVNGRSLAETRASHVLRDVLVPEVARFVHTAEAMTLPSVLQVKPPAPESRLAAHQDSPLVDERKFSGFYVWVSLTDSTVDNGALFVLPGSHRFATWPRVANAHDELAMYHHVIQRHARVVESRAGQVVIFHNALIHGSLVNVTASERVAASCVVVPRRTEMVVPVAVGGPAPGRIELRQIDTTRLERGEDPPDDLGDLVGTAFTARLEFSPSSLDALCWLNRLRWPEPPGRPIPEDRRA
jgi:hypothetical protein